MPKTIKPTTPLKYLSVCSGMEAASVAWKHLGWEPIGFSEIDPFTSAILKHHYPTTPNYGNITKYNEWPIEPGSVDILIGGTPCQSFSVAGKRGGLNDPRGQIMHSFIGIAEKFKPKFIIWENVPGVLSSGEPKGIDFATFLQGLAQHGYHIAYRVLNSQWFGVPQRRRRIFVVACLTDWEHSAKILSIPESLSGYSTQIKKTRETITANVGNGINQNCQFPFRKSKRASSVNDDETWVPADVSNTLNNFDVGDTRKTHAVVIPIQGTIIGRSENAGPMGPGASQPGTPMYTLTKTDVHAVMYENHPSDSRITGPLNVAPTVTSRYGTGGGNVPYIQEKPFSFIQRQNNEIYCNENTVSTINSTSGMNQTNFIKMDSIVRRLTPIETERLQGFPDNYSQISWKGKPAEQCPDGPRYKACGNSFAVPVVRWIGEQIQKHINGEI